VSDERTINLGGQPDPRDEIRLQSGDCVVSIWLPASLRPMSAAINALTAAGFDQQKPDA
jgi:hypothetical protein